MMFVDIERYCIIISVMLSRSKRLVELGKRNYAELYSGKSANEVIGQHKADVEVAITSEVNNAPLSHAEGHIDDDELPISGKK